jgi:hypothetical protein
VLTGSASPVSEEVRTCARQAPLRKAPACRRRPPGSGYSGRGFQPKQRPTLTQDCGCSFSLGDIRTVDTAGRTRRRRGCCGLMHCIALHGTEKGRTAIMRFWISWRKFGLSIPPRMYLPKHARIAGKLPVACCTVCANARHLLLAADCVFYRACCTLQVVRLDVACRMLCDACSKLS